MSAQKFRDDCGWSGKHSCSYRAGRRGIQRANRSKSKLKVGRSGGGDMGRNGGGAWGGVEGGDLGRKVWSLHTWYYRQSSKCSSRLSCFLPADRSSFHLTDSTLVPFLL